MQKWKSRAKNKTKQEDKIAEHTLGHFLTGPPLLISVQYSSLCWYLVDNSCIMKERREKAYLGKREACSMRQSHFSCSHSTYVGLLRQIKCGLHMATVYAENSKFKFSRKAYSSKSNCNQPV